MAKEPDRKIVGDSIENTRIVRKSPESVQNHHLLILAVGLGYFIAKLAMISSLIHQTLSASAFLDTAIYTVTGVFAIPLVFANILGPLPLAAWLLLAVNWLGISSVTVLISIIALSDTAPANTSAGDIRKLRKSLWFSSSVAVFAFSTAPLVGFDTLTTIEYAYALASPHTAILIAAPTGVFSLPSFVWGLCIISLIGSYWYRFYDRSI